ncbi:hypothetical protein [Halobacillus campisalis]|uniref:Uncharacterized protein n=1 Tax=Halobacillus campisalis TaxID=435909 RepID=A0ABW2K4R2_9BACI|nr:hypothetical protein [Halobacillus campisalis]
MNDDKNKKHTITNEAAELLSHPVKFNQAFIDNKEEENIEKEGEAMFNHYAD